MCLVSLSYIFHLYLCKNITVKTKEDKMISYFSVHSYKYIITGVLIKTMNLVFYVMSFNHNYVSQPKKVIGVISGGFLSNLTCLPLLSVSLSDYLPCLKLPCAFII